MEKMQQQQQKQHFINCRMFFVSVCYAVFLTLLLPPSSAASVSQMSAAAGSLHHEDDISSEEIPSISILAPSEKIRNIRALHLGQRYIGLGKRLEASESEKRPSIQGNTAMRYIGLGKRTGGQKAAAAGLRFFGLGKRNTAMRYIGLGRRGTDWHENEEPLESETEMDDDRHLVNEME